MANGAPVLELKEVRFRWRGGPSFEMAVPEFVMGNGEKVLLLGDSGSGKSTLLSLICGTLNVDAGKVSVAGTDLSGLSNKERDGFRAEQIGVVFQQFNLLPFGKVRDNILLPLRFAPNRRARANDPENESTELCRSLNLPDGVLDARASTLSVGQQQRVAVARALIGRPPLIVADEPTSSLDATSQTAFLDLMFAQIDAHEGSLLMVSHDPRLADRFDRVVQMEDIATSIRAAA